MFSENDEPPTNVGIDAMDFLYVLQGSLELTPKIGMRPRFLTPINRIIVVLKTETRGFGRRVRGSGATAKAGLAKG